LVWDNYLKNASDRKKDLQLPSLRIDFDDNSRISQALMLLPEMEDTTYSSEMH
jgi:hypothetical protein